MPEQVLALANLMNEQLIARAQRGDSEAITTLYHQHVGRIAKYVGYRVTNAQSVEDITASVFLVMMEKLPKYQERGVPFEAWLYRIASAQIGDHYRHQKKYPTTTLNIEQSAQEAPIEKQLMDKEQYIELRGALNQLSDEEQTILFLRLVERLPHTEVAVLLGKKPQAIATAQHRALKRLAALMGKEG